MEDPLPYREHTGQDPEVEMRLRAQRTVLIGLAIFAVACLAVLGPLMWGRWELNKYVITIGLVGVFCGLSAMINGAWDWWQGRES